MTLGTVVKVQVPLIITFDDDDVEVICSTLKEALERSYEIIDFFQFEIEEGNYED